MLRVKNVVVVGGGDTGSDCVGTAIRQGAKSVTQVQLHKAPPKNRYPSNPWPEWPRTYQTSSSQAEGCVAAVFIPILSGDWGSKSPSFSD